ncbi:MAG: hypothetical protein V1904_10960 [Bacteroidota bacterium]
MFFKIKPGFIIWSDAEGYYQYLPYAFIKFDITHQAYAATLENGMTLNKYTCGVALLEAPFFFIAHIYNKIFGLTANGFTYVYGISIWFAAITYVYLGLVLLYKILRNWFHKAPSIIAVLAVYLCTNLFYYSHVQPGMSHAYSFFVLSLFVFSLDKLIRSPGIAISVLCGVSLGLALLIRPTNVFYVLLFLLFEIYSLMALRARLRWMMKNAKYLFVILLLIFIVFIPQMLYWHAVTGKYFVYSYAYSYGQAETFEFWNAPKIGYVLFGVESGWFIYSPIFFFFIAGILWMIFSGNKLWIAILLLFVLILYANASWWAYTFSCSYGHRAFIEYYPLFIIPVAFLLKKVFYMKRKFLLSITVFLIVVFAFVNIRMSQLYYKESCWIRPGWTWEHYNRLLNKVFFIYPQNKSIK